MESETYKLLMEKKNGEKEENKNKEEEKKEEIDSIKGNSTTSLEKSTSLRNKRTGIFFRKSTFKNKDIEVKAKAIIKEEGFSHFSKRINKINLESFSNRFMSLNSK